MQQNTNAQRTSARGGFFQRYFVRPIEGVFTGPSLFFRNLKKEQAVGGAFTYYAVFLFFSSLLGMLMSVYVMFPLIKSYVEQYFPFPLPPVEFNAGTLLLGYMIGLAISFLVAGIVHVWALIFGGQGSYTNSYNLYVYSRTPKLLFGWVPFIGFFASIYSLVLLIIGTQHIHGISRMKSILMYAVPYVLFFLFAVAILLIAAVLFKDMFQGQLPFSGGGFPW